MIYARKYLQFNDLVFDNFDMLKTSDNTSNTFKYTTVEYGYRHGSYLPLFKNYSLLKESSVSLTIFLNMKKVVPEQRTFYHDLVTQQLTRAGYLWAIQDGKLIYTPAIVSGYDEVTTNKEEQLEIDVSFTLPEGVWHMADPTNTFLKTYDVTDVLEYYGFEQHTRGNLPDDKYSTRALQIELADGTIRNYNVLINTGGQLPLQSKKLTVTTSNGVLTYDVYVASKSDTWYDIIPFKLTSGTTSKVYNICVLKGESGKIPYNQPKDLYDVEATEALAYTNDIEAFYHSCAGTYFIVRDCEKAETYFGYSRYDKLTAKNGIVADTLYVNTNLPTRDYEMVLTGKMTDVTISINGNINTIKGTYENLRILGNGQAIGDDRAIPIEKWIVPNGSTYGFEFVPQSNRVAVTGFTGAGNIYILANGITI